MIIGYVLTNDEDYITAMGGQPTPGFVAAWLPGEFDYAYMHCYFLEPTTGHEGAEYIAVLDEARKAEYVAEEQRGYERAEAQTRARAYLEVQQVEQIAVSGTPDDAIHVMALFPAWAPGNYIQSVGQARMYNDYPYRVLQPHDSTHNPGWTPEAVPALWAPYHGTTPETALPFVVHSGAPYKQGEMMVWTDGRVYKCKQDTTYSPAEYAQVWEVTL